MENPTLSFISTPLPSPIPRLFNSLDYKLNYDDSVTGSFIGLMSLVTLEIVGIDDMAQGYGIMLFSIGVPIAFGPPTIGKSYNQHIFDGYE